MKLEWEKIIINNLWYAFTLYLDFSSVWQHVSYGVVNVIYTPPFQKFTCETNLLYDIVKKKDNSTVSQFSPTPLYESVQ